MAQQYDITISDQSLATLLEARKKLIVSYPVTKIWNQKGVSLQRRTAEDSAFSERVNAVLTAQNLQKYIVTSSVTAPTRCIDGRITKGYDPNHARQLGPKIAGGTAHAALAHRVVDIDNTAFQLQFEDDIRFVIQQYKEIGIGFGGHIDDHASAHNTGCGAVDNIHLILDRLQRPEPQEQLRGLSKIILGDAYDRALVNEVLGRMLYLDALKPQYLPKENDDPNGEFLYKRTINEMIRSEANKNDEPIAALTGTHNEVAAVLNFVPNTTFDTDRFSADNDNKIQVFGWDVWEMFEEARRLYRYVMQGPLQTQQDAIINRLKHVTTRTLLGLATVMVLTDGSLKVAIIQKTK